MQWRKLRERIARLDLQAKVVVVLVLVIAPTFLIVSLAVSQLIIPVIEEEIRILGTHTGKDLAEEIQTHRVLTAGREDDLEKLMLSTFYYRPGVLQVDAFRLNESGEVVLAATTEEPHLAVPPPQNELPERLLSYSKQYEDGNKFWEIWAPIRSGKKEIVGVVRLEISTETAASMGHAVRKIMVIGGAANIVVLILALSYFLRKTISNDRMLRIAESQNVELSKQLRETERQLMTSEKLAVMGQLTASFAHEIGTPLNAVGGHLQLLQQELRVGGDPSWLRRLDVIRDQLTKIEKIVKGFLQSTAKPPSQFQLLDVNQVLEKTVGIVRPRIDSLGIRLEKSLDKKLGPLRAVPLDIEQVLLNLLNNSLDSIQSKTKEDPHATSKLEITSRYRKEGRGEWVELAVFDSGEGISKQDISSVFKPFFTTKPVGEGTGLGLTICQEIAKKYGGNLEIESKEGAWTKVTFKLPYGANA